MKISNLNRIRNDNDQKCKTEIFINPNNLMIE